MQKWLAGAVLAGVMSGAAPVVSAASLNMRFVNETGLPDDQVFITFQDPSRTLDARYGSDAEVGRGADGDLMTRSLSLAQIGIGGLDVFNAEGTVIFVSYAATLANNGFDMDGDLSGNHPPSFIGTGGANYAKAYQPFEVTYVQGATGGQGNLTNINYFTAPIAVTTYNGGAGGTPLQSRGYFGGTAQGTARIGADLAALTAGPNSVLATATRDGRVLRYIGPSSYGAQTNPYPDFDSYIDAIHAAGQTATIRNHNAFNTQATPGPGNVNYNYKLDLTASFAADRTITLSGTVTQIVTPFGGSSSVGKIYEGTSMTISPTVGPNTSAAIFENTIYGQADPLGVGNGSTAFNAVWREMADDMAGLGLYLNSVQPGLTYGITRDLAIGEITTALLGGFVGSELIYAGGVGDNARYNGMLYKNVPSEAWWHSTIIPSPSDLQPDHPFYSAYSDVIFDSSDNGVYSIPYSDRLGHGPLMETQLYNGQVVDTWVVTLGPPLFAVPEPGLRALLLFGGGSIVLLAWRKRRTVAQPSH